jgi:hypothetical protein
MRRLLGHLAVALAVALTLGATAAGQKLKIESEFDKGADFTAVKTYAWLPPAPMIKNVAPGALSNPNLTDEVLGPHITAAIDRQLARRGLTKAGRDQADVLVVYLAAMTVGFSRTYLGEYYGYVTGWGSPIPPGLAPSTSSDIHEQGTIVVDMVQRASNRAIWRGSVVTRVHQERKLEDRIERINEAAERMFERFPIRAGK